MDSSNGDDLMGESGELVELIDLGEIDELRARIDALEAQLNPPKKEPREEFFDEESGKVMVKGDSGLESDVEELMTDEARRKAMDEERQRENERRETERFIQENTTDENDYAEIGDDPTIPEDDYDLFDLNDAASVIDLGICQFGLADKLIDDSSAANKIHILSGNVKKGIETMVTIAEADVTIPYADTYVGLQITRGLGSGAIITSSTLAGVTPDSSVFRCWFYRFTLSSGNATLKNINLGQIMDVDITGYGD